MSRFDQPPPDLKCMTQYMQRANELDDNDPVVAYYCRYYAARLAVDQGAKSKDAQMYLLALLDRLEKVEHFDPG